jgi:DNA polymerase bacteriophage-type
MIHPDKLVGLDFETYASVSLPDVGLARYVHDPYFMPTLASVATSRGTLTCEFPAEHPHWMRDMLLLEPGLVVSAHNAGFERAVLKTMGISIPVIDSAVVAAVAGADRHLAGAAQQLMQDGKLDEDRSLLRLFAMQQKDQQFPQFDRSLISMHRDKWEQYKAYCERDAELSRGIILDWHGDDDLFDREMRYAQITLDMNEAGWPVDIASVEEMRKRYLSNLEQLEHDFAVDIDPGLNLASHVQVKKWCADRGIRSASFDKQNVERLLARLLKEEAKHPLKQEHYEVLAMLKTKQALGGSSLKKLETILATAYEGRVYDQYVHAGAPQSLRTSGRSIQMQNLPRLEHVRNMDDLMVPSYYWTNEELAGNIRQLFTSSHPAGQLLVADFASIESRALAYQAGETWKTDAYARGEDVYKAQAMKIFRLNDINAVTKEQRTTGKVGELSCGYGAGPVAVKDFAAKMHVDLTEGEAGQLVRDWRDANTHTVEFWDRLGKAFTETVETGTTHAVRCGHNMSVNFVPARTPASLLDQMAPAQTVEMCVWKDGKRVMTRVFHGCYLRGRNVGYHKPSSLKGGRPWKTKYIDPKTKRPRFYELYGGKLAGILTQSLCREIFFESLQILQFRLQSYDNVTIVGQFHDEVVVDWVPGRLSMRDTMAVMRDAMSSSPTHPGLPMGVEVKHDYRYTK